MTLTDISWIIFSFGPVTAGIGFVSGLFKFSSRPLFQKLLCILMGVSAFCDVLSIRLPKQWQNTAGNFSRIAEFIFLFIIFYIAIESRQLRRAFVAAGAICFAYMVWKFFIEMQQVSSYSNSLLGLIFIAMSIAYFWSLIQMVPMPRISTLPMFWISSGVLFYTAGSLLLFLAYDYVLRQNPPNANELLFVYWDIHNVFASINNLFYTAALWLGIRAFKSPS